LSTSVSSSTTALETAAHRQQSCAIRIHALARALYRNGRTDRRQRQRGGPVAGAAASVGGDDAGARDATRRRRRVARDRASATYSRRRAPQLRLASRVHSRHVHIYTHTHPFNGPLSMTTRVSRYQKGKPIRILLKQETVSGSGIRWAICKSASRSRQTTTPAPHHSAFYRPDALPAAQPTASKH